jgi:quinoprotein glucose dehydrogenase
MRSGIVGALVVVAAATGGSWLIRAQDETRAAEWRSSGGDSTYKRYSPLAQINRDNVKNLRIVWRHSALDPKLKEQFPKLRTSNYLRATPTMIGGVLYGPDAAGLIEAFDAATGATIWRQDPGPEMATETSASSTRGVDFWKGGSADYRLFTVRNGYLYALDLRGKAVAGFGSGGRTSLVPAGARSFGWSSGPIVVGDVVVIAGNLDGAGDGGQKWKNSPPENVRGFDARSGKLLWTFHVVPREGEFGADTWGHGSGKLSGDLGSWCCISADEQLGYVYVPLTPTPMRKWITGVRIGTRRISTDCRSSNHRTPASSPST